VPDLGTDITYEAMPEIMGKTLRNLAVRDYQKFLKGDDTAISK
jgi:hypothetical protein